MNEESFQLGDNHFLKKKEDLFSCAFNLLARHLKVAIILHHNMLDTDVPTLRAQKPRDLTKIMIFYSKCMG